MKKYGLRILVGLLAFGMGCALSLIWEFNQNNACHYVAQDNSKPEFSDLNYSNPNGKIEVRFIGIGQNHNRPTLRFKITNNTPFVIENFRTGSKRFQGKDIQEFWTGACALPRPKTLKPIESVVEEFSFSKKMYKLLNKKGKFEFGFYLTIDNHDVEILSDPIIISEELKLDIIQNAPEFLKQK